jgi:pyrroline-5-carboxylate reductase
MSTTTNRLLLIGCGKMGGAMLQGWLDRDLDYRVTVVEPSGILNRFEGLPNISAVADSDSLAADYRADVVVVAVKPQILPDLMSAYAPFLRADTLVISIAAGVTSQALAKALGSTGPLVRAMPNTPAAIGRGVSVLVANAAVSKSNHDTASRLMAALGDIVWIDDEADMDAVTALSGSGPAYVFHLIEAMAAGGVALGLEPELAMRLARATMSGSGELVRRTSDDAASLRAHVTSPGGTTAAALSVLMGEQGLLPLVEAAMVAARDRSRELTRP